MTARDHDADAFEAGMRAGFAHGYEIGVANGRAETEIPYVEDAPRVRLSGPTLEERIARGYIPIDRTRPPALPARMWDASEWAKADERDLPFTEYGHAQWRVALAAGRVPQHLADAYAAANPDRAPAPRRTPTAELAERVTHDVAEAGRAVQRTRTAGADPPAVRTQEPDDVRRRSADRSVPLERGIA